MIGAFVTFRYGDDFDESAVRGIADTARARFEGMPGLRSKAFTVSPAKREAANFYVWESEQAATAFFTDALVERVTGLYACVRTSSSCRSRRWWRTRAREAPARGSEDPGQPARGVLRVRLMKFPYSAGSS